MLMLVFIIIKLSNAYFVIPCFPLCQNTHSDAVHPHTYLYQVWEAGSGEGLSIPLQAQELVMLVIGCHHLCHRHDHHHHHHHHDDHQQEDDQEAAITGELVCP